MPNQTGIRSQAASSVAGTGSLAVNQTTITITPKLVRQVADKVYARLLAELLIERERSGAHRRASPCWRGGRPC